MIRPALAFCVALALLGAARQDNPTRYYERGLAAAAEKKFNVAVECFRMAIELTRVDPEVTEEQRALLRANLHRALKNYSIDLAAKDNFVAALRVCREAIAMATNDITVASNLAVFFQNEAAEKAEDGDFEQARAAIEQAEQVVDEFQLLLIKNKIEETHSRILLLEGRHFFFEKNDPGKAREMFNKAISINPNEADTYLDRSFLWYQQDLFSDAINDLEKANNILGNLPEIRELTRRIQSEAGEKGVLLTDKTDFFIWKWEGIGINPLFQQALERNLDSLRVEVAGDLQINPAQLIRIYAYGDRPLTRVEEWLLAPPRDYSGEQFEIGLNGVDVESRDVEKALRFQYVKTLILNIGGPTVPYWYVIGMAQLFMDSPPRISEQEEQGLLRYIKAGDTFGVDRLNYDTVSQLVDPEVLGRANLESKALTSYLLEEIRLEGARRLLESLGKGNTFEQALAAIANLSPQEVEQEWIARLR